MTTPTDTDPEPVAPPSHLARVIALATLHEMVTDLGTLDPILNQALTDAGIKQAAVLLRRIGDAQQLLATLKEMVERHLTRLTGANGVFPLGNGEVIERAGGRSTSRRKAWDRPRLAPLVAKKAAALAWQTVGVEPEPSSVMLAVSELAATLALGCVPSDWRIPGLRALGLDPERYSDEAAPSRTTFTIRPADEAPDDTE
jgi:hypothetical protein